MLLEHGAHWGDRGLYQPVDLGIARCRLCVAVPAGFDYANAVRRGARLRVATKYVQTAREHFAAKGVHVDLIKLYGSMELAPLAGLADVIVDLVSSGSTLKANKLVEVEEVAPISARLIVNQSALKVRREELMPLIARIEDAAAALVTPMNVRRLNASDPSFDAQFAALIATDTAIDREVERVAGEIVDDVKRRGDAALLEYTNRFDRINAATVAELEIRAPEMREALDSLGGEQRGALETAAQRIRAFHQRQLATSWSYTEADGTELGQRVGALQSVGLVCAWRARSVSVIGADERAARASGRRRKHCDGRTRTWRRA